MDWIQYLLIPLILSAFMVVILLGGFAYLSYFERKVVARFTMRYGPNRAGPFGLLQPIADAIKMAFKEELMPAHADKTVYILAPALAVSSALLAWGVIPIASQGFQLFGYYVPPFIANINVALLYISAVTSIGIYGIVLAGWASNNKYSLLGALRTSAQMVSYELPLGITLVSLLLVVGSMRMTNFIDYQVNHIWLIFLQPLAFIIFFIAGLAELNRSPFDLPETENELVSGFMTEYGGIRFALFFMGEYIHMITASAIIATLFLGGWHGPFAQEVPFLGAFYLIAKIVLMLFLMIWVRASVPRVRYDHLMSFCWKILVPLSLLNVAVTAIVVTVAN
ncbi:MAG TPA: NADH-quinone oxidoreductase subunit NuoH [Chloroflexi bacterium]|nr:MAG: NADH-quinone oxidoreductase subunit H [Anaerolineaceae bacterium 4572_5.2]HEY83852.1 NADH-quinone oxidoreductase subunit NuoH [Chloroflexota bacterium]